MNIEKTIRNLKLFGADVLHFATKEEAAEYLVSTIQNTTVGIGGSRTIDQLDVYDKLLTTNDVAWHWKQGSTEEVFQRAHSAKVYLTSANALAETGELVFIDGRGNRVSAISAPLKKRICVVVSTNKIMENLNEAISRARCIAPENVKRMPGKRPCELLGRCVDCRVPDRMCRAFLILCGKELEHEKLEVILVDEPMGL